jgi:signal recognition particle subunit SRP54
MFESLNDKLGSIFDALRGQGKLNEDHVNDAMREIRVALLEADVALPVVKAFIETIKERAIGQAVIKSVSPAQQVVKIVNDGLIELLGSTQAELNFGKSPSVFLMAGLQGSGKTTSAAKLAHFLKTKQRKKILLASLDIYRPAAQEQLAILGQQINVDTLDIVAGEKPLDITKRALEKGRMGFYDVVILDSAGRLSIDDALMQELSSVRDLAKPIETLLVADAMTGQDAVNTAAIFNERIGVTGIILTRIDGDARGGAAVAMRAVTGCPIKFLGVGEKWDALEIFHPDRIVGRILGMGDVVSLVEKATETIDKAQAEKMAKKLQKGKFDFEDLLAQMQQMQNMGGMGAIMKMLPGLGKVAKQMEGAIDENVFKRQQALILSMTPKERRNPDLLNASRRRRIAMGAGLNVHELNKLVKQQQQMETMMKRIKKMGMGGMMNMAKGLMGEKDIALMEADMAGHAPLEFGAGGKGVDLNPDVLKEMSQKMQLGGLSGGLPPALQNLGRSGLPNSLLNNNSFGSFNTKKKK